MKTRIEAGMRDSGQLGLLACLRTVQHASRLRAQLNHDDQQRAAREVFEAVAETGTHSWAA
jgi:hypothetical protein